MNSLSQIINNKLLPELRELGIPCPDTACDVHRPATEYHEFTITTFFRGKGVIPSRICRRKSAHIKIEKIPPGLRLSEITAIIPATPDSLPELGIDTAEKTLQLEDPELFKLAIAIITARWRAMQRYEDIRILDYIETHSQTERALFGQHHINRLLFLAGHEPDMDIPWISLHYESAIHYIKQARQRMNYQTL